MYKINRREIVIHIILLLVVTILTSAFTAYFVASQSNVRFVAEPREDNQDFGYLEVKGKRYYQFYTTTQVDIGNGLHYHRIDLRGSDK